MLSLSSSGAGDFSSSWTWGAVIALAALVVSTWLVVNHRHRDQTVQWHQPDYDTARDALLVLNRLSLTTAVEGVTAELRELVDVVSRLRIAEQRSPDLPFGVIVAELEGYRANVLPQNHAAKLAGDESLLDDYLALARVQGIRLQAARTAIVRVQRKIEKRIRN
ncbi:MULTISPECIES: hypothetical protein [Streptomyces]|uniref:DUF2489 domain-containing protein n=1 Tax=Streptomyces yatensis TaxID=155177 RepID=A0ABN2JNF2_9ACTN|nr:MULTISPECIES: hypothetical protein [Streptomyces]MCG0284087.1 hypothetical protein [Streptomyces sp. PSAA01]